MPRVIGLNAAMFPLAVLVIGPLLPRLIAPSRQRCARSGLGLSVTALSILLLPLLPCLPRLVPAALPHRHGRRSIHWVVSETWLNMVATERDRGRIMGIYATVLAAGFAIGPLIIGAVGIEGWLPFLIVALAVALGVLPICFARRPGAGHAGPKPRPRSRDMLRAQPLVMARRSAAG